MPESDINKRLFSLLEEECKLKTVKEMLQAGADPNYKKPGVAKHLLKAGAVVGGSEIVMSVQSMPMLQLLLNNGGDINARSKDGSTVLHASILKWVTDEEEQLYVNQPRVKRLEALISLGADPRISDQNSLLPFDYALLQGEAEEVELLMAATNALRSELDQQDENGRTPLIRAVILGNIAVVKDLLAQGANTDIRDKQLHSALSLAIKKNRDDIAEILVSNGAEYSKAIKAKTAPQLLKAIERGYLGNVWLGLRAGMPVPSLSQIIEFGQPRFIPLLLQKGASYLGVEKHIDAGHRQVTSELFPLLMAKPEHIDLGDDLQDSIKKTEEIVRLVRTIKEKYPDDLWMENYDYAYEDVEWAGPAWNLRILSVPADMADRRKSMLAGPFFTNEDFPWPKSLTEDSPGKFASPVVQIDLGVISELRNMAFGDGTLQVFESNGGSIIRVIPKQVIETTVMTPVAPSSEDDLYFPLVPTEWLSGGEVQHILGYEGPVFSCHAAEEDAFDESPSEVKKLANLMKEVACQNDSGLHLFGTFYPVQYRASEKGAPVFLSLDSDHGYFWGDSGTAQVFYKMTNDGPEFSFDWSCY
jgi:ankyrin repeat protein